MSTTDVASARSDRPAGAWLQIERVLADREGAAFRVQGRCMYPTIRAGDLLRVRSCGVASVSVGDIAVFRRLGHLFAHRVISKRVTAGRSFVVTRPDGADDGADPPICDDDLLGIVVAVERNSRPVPLTRMTHPWLVRRYFDLRLALMHVGWLALGRWTRRWARVQDSETYRRIARGWLLLTRPRISYTVNVPLRAFGDFVYRQMTPESFDPRQCWRGRPIGRWILTLHLNGRREPAAKATLARDSDDDWYISELSLAPRYRGTPLEDALMRKVADILRAGSPHLPATAGLGGPLSSANAASPGRAGGRS